MSLRTCPNGHQYHKTSNCPTCPICEQHNRPTDGFMATLAAPARRALKQAGISSLQQLSTKTETELLQLHGIGPGSLPKLRSVLAQFGLELKTFK